MKLILEKEVEEIKDKESVKTISEVVDIKEATHKHYCRHDEDPPKACRRVKI